MSAYELLGVALVTGVIGPLFWLGVNVMENRLRAAWSRLRPLLREQVAQRKAARTARKLRGP